MYCSEFEIILVQLFTLLNETLLQGNNHSCEKCAKYIIRHPEFRNPVVLDKNILLYLL